MLTYQDLLVVGERPTDIADFVHKVISQHESTELYKTAKAAQEYDRGLNTTIMNYQKLVTEITGRRVVDQYSANHRSASGFFHIDITQLNSYLLGNGIKWEKDDTKDRLGRLFDNRIEDAGHKALSGGVSFGFWNLDHLEVFSVLEFAPLFDEETGALAAGVRYWQIDKNKPLRATLYTPEGYMDFLWNTDPNFKVDSTRWDALRSDLFFRDMSKYIITVARNETDGVEIVDGRNYDTLPIVPLYANRYKQSELVGLREKIDAYDMIASGYVNDLDNAQIYWIIKGAGGMDDPDLVQFLDRLRTVKAAAPADGQEVQPVEVNIPYEAREKLLDRLKEQLYEDAMLMNPDDIRAGNVTATQIRAAYERQNVKADAYEYQVIEFLDGILKLAGIEDTPTFTRSTIINTSEEITTLVTAAAYLGQEYVTKRILTLLGDGDNYEEVQKQIDAGEAERLTFEE